MLTIRTLFSCGLLLTDISPSGNSGEVFEQSEQDLVKHFRILVFYLPTMKALCSNWEPIVVALLFVVDVYNALEILLVVASLLENKKMSTKAMLGFPVIWLFSKLTKWITKMSSSCISWFTCKFVPAVPSWKAYCPLVGWFSKTFGTDDWNTSPWLLNQNPKLELSNEKTELVKGP